MSPLTVRQLHESVRGHLRRLVRRASLAWAGVLVAVVLALAWLLAGGQGWDPGSAVPLALDVSLLVALAVGVLTLRRWGRRELSDARVAHTMEDAAGLPGGTVLGTLELGRGVPAGVSASLVQRSERHVAERLVGEARTLAGSTGRTVASWGRRGLRTLAFVAPVLALLLLVSPRRTATAWSGLGVPLRVLAKPTLPPLEVDPGSVELPRGAALDVRVEAAWRESVTIHWQAAGDVVRSEAVPVLDDVGHWTADEVTAALEYWVSAPDGARTPVYRVTPVDPLFVSDVTVHLDFPDYTGRADEEYRGDAPPLEIPSGTRIRIEGQGSRALSRGELVRQGEEAADAALALDLNGTAFAGSWVPRRSGTYQWVFIDAEGDAAELVPRPLQLTVVPDLPPRVEIALPGRDTVLPLTLKQPLVIQTADDYGVSWLELVAWRVTALGEPQEPVRQRVELGGVPGALARPLMDVSRWGLLPGDQVRYYARAVDNSPAAQEARTREFVLRMPDATSLQREAQQQLDSAATALEDLAERARRSAEETRNQDREARSPDRSGQDARRQPSAQGDEQVDFEEREDLQRAVDEQEAMASQVDSLRQELSDLSNTLQEAGAQDPELGKDLEELQDLLNEVGGPELRQKLQELSERMSEMDRQQARQALSELAGQEEQFRQRLEEALDRMKRAAVEQDFRATTSEAEELAKQEDVLSQAMADEAQGTDRAKQQEELQQRAGDMDARMEKLGERLQELGEQDAARGVEQARQQGQQSMQSMSEAARQARAQQGQQAGAQASQAAEQMSDAAQELRDAQQQMQQQRAEALQRALQQTSQDALSLARRQAELQQSMQDASPQEMADMRGDVAAVEQGVRNMAENLSAATRKAGASGGEREIGTAMGQAMAALQQTISAMDSPSASPRSPGTAAEQSVDALNQIAMQARAAAQQMSQGQQSGTSAEQMMQALERMAQQQADVNNQAGQMMPMQLSQQALQQQMQQLSQGQQSVASDLDDLARKESDEGPLGDLEAMAEEAEALARELAQGRLDPETRRRQEELFHHLLDAGRSLEKEEYSDERESETPGTFEPGEVAELTRDALGLLRFQAPDAETLGRLPPAARALVLRYFQRLNRAGSGEAPPPTSPGGS